MGKLPTLTQIQSYCHYLYNYRNLLKSLIKKEFKGKFKHTTLGYLWHVINPLSQLIIYYIVFSAMFGSDVKNYWIYISTGMFAFSFISSCVVGGSVVITNNSKLITKMAFPRELLVFARVLSNLLTLCISYLVLSILILLTGSDISTSILFLLMMIPIYATFTLGLALILSSVTVYIRDLTNASNVAMTCLMFATPIFYMTDYFDNPIVNVMWHINPLYYYIDAIHSCMYLSCIPSVDTITLCIFLAILSICVGLATFKKLEHHFAERL